MSEIELREEAARYVGYVATSILDAAFLIIWVGLQYGTGLVIDNFPLSGIDEMVLTVFQYLFAISTLSPILLGIIKTQSILVYRTFVVIKSETEER